MGETARMGSRVTKNKARIGCSKKEASESPGASFGKVYLSANWSLARQLARNPQPKEREVKERNTSSNRWEHRKYE